MRLTHWASGVEGAGGSVGLRFVWAWAPSSSACLALPHTHGTLSDRNRFSQRPCIL